MTRRVPRHLVETVIDKVNIVELIGQYLPLRKSGSYHSSVCPFHADKDPSFMVSEVKQFYHCYGCHKGGNALQFMMDYHGYSFREALQSLADLAGVELTLAEEDGTPSLPARREFVELNDFATRFFRKHLDSAEAAQAYLNKRGISTAMVERFHLGYAPDAWDLLAHALASLGQEALKKAEVLGLVAPRKERAGDFYDRFRHRLQFPIFNVDGRVAGFSGRTLGQDPDTPKYLNSPDSHLYHKGRLLFGLHQARDTIRTKGRVVLVEGNVDVVSMHQAGFSETVAPLGTALTPQQAMILKRAAKDVVLLFDGDSAGIRAGLRSVEVFLDAEVHPRLALLPKGDDPDSFLRTRPAQEMEALLAGAEYGMDFVVRRFVDPNARTAAEKARGVDEVVPYLRHIQGAVERELYARKAAERAGVEVRSVMAGVTFQAAPKPAPADLDAQTNHLLGLFKACVEEPPLLGELDEVRLEVIDDPAVRQLFRRASETWREEHAVRPEVVYEVELPDALRDRFAHCFLEDARYPDETRRRAFDQCLAALSQQHLQRRINELQKQVEKLAREDATANSARIFAIQTELKRCREERHQHAEARTQPTSKGKVHVQEVH
jgi:DNA primase